MKIKTIIFDLSGTLVKMRPPKLLVKRALLSRLAKNLKLGIITGAKRVETQNILFKFGILDYFDFVISKDDSLYKKPDRRLLWDQKEFDPKAIIYIGDTKKDFVFAQNLNVRFCYVGKKKYGIYQNQDINKILKLIVQKLLK